MNPTHDLHVDRCYWSSARAEHAVELGPRTALPSCLRTGLAPDRPSRQRAGSAGKSSCGSDIA